MTFQPPRPPTYSGRRCNPEELDSWISSMTDYLDFTSVEDDKKARFGNAYLVGQAKEWYNETSAITSFTDWDNLCDRLRNRFYPANYHNTIRKKLNRRRQITAPLGEPMDIDAHTIDKKYKGKLSPQLRRLLINENRCFYCRNQGHQIENCSKKPKLSQGKY